MNKKKSDILNIKLDEEEQEISDAIDQAIGSGSLKSIDNLKKEIAFAQKAARAKMSMKEARKISNKWQKQLSEPSFSDSAELLNKARKR